MSIHNSPDRQAKFLAWVYQFERDILTKNYPLGDGYALPPCWRPGHPVWKKLAAFAQNQGIDPVRYTRWSLEVRQVGYPPDVPEPNRLLERARMEHYLADQPEVRGRLEEKLACEKAAARRRITLRQSLYADAPAVAHLDAVTGPFCDLSPLFRYALARSISGERMMQIAEKYEAEALFQFSCYPEEYEAVYAADDVIPNGFADKAARFYAQVVEWHARGVAREVQA